nr:MULTISPECIES: transposase [unclassified Nannocystis]
MAQPADASEPVVALDERPVVLRDPARPGRPASPGRMARQDYEYVRRGTANIFCIVEPKAGRHLTYATPNRTAKQFARALRRIAQRYRSARTIHLVMDNLNTHRDRPEPELRLADPSSALSR